MSLLDKARQHKAENGGGQGSDFSLGVKEDKPGDAYEGVVTAVRTVNTKFGEKPAIDIQLADGKTVTALGFRSGLADAIKRANPKVGDKVATWFEGTKKTKSGNMFNVYEFYTESGLSGDAGQADDGALPF